MQSVKYQNILYLLYIIFMSADPFSAYSGIDKGHRIVFLIEILTLVFLYNSNKSFKKVFCYDLNIVWFILIFYHWINCMIQNVPCENGYYLIFYPIFSSFIILVLSCYLYLQNPYKASIVFSIGFLSYVFLGVMSGNYIEDSSGNVRLTGSIHMNQLGQAAGFSLFMLLILKQYIRKSSLMKMLLLSTLPLYGIIHSGSRNALIILLIVVFAMLLTRVLSYRISVKFVVYLLMLGIVAYFSIDFLVEHTTAGQRLLETTEQAEMQDIMYHTGTFFDLLGDRGWYYYVGFLNFIDNPILGIGMWNFKYYNNASFPLHTEYMVHITEGGIIAASLYFYFIYRIAKGLIRINIRQRTELGVILGLWFVSYLIVCFTARAFFYYQFYVIMGIAIAVIMKYDTKQKL